MCRRTKLQSIVLKITSALFDVSTDGLDGQISQALEAFGEFARADHGYMAQFHNGTTQLYTHHWSSPDCAAYRDSWGELDLYDKFPWFAERIRSLDTVHVPRVADLPDEAAVERTWFQKHHVQSAVAAPVFAQGDLIGYIGLESAHEQHAWSREELALLRLVGSCIGNVLYRRRVETLLRIQRDLAIALGSTSDLGRALGQVLEAAIGIDGIDCGGVYFLDEPRGNLRLVAHKGISPEYVEQTSWYGSDSPSAQLVMTGKPVYRQRDETRMRELLQREGLRAVAVLPVTYAGEVVAVLNLASRSLDDIPIGTRQALEAIAPQIGGALARTKSAAALAQSQTNLQNLFDTLDDFVFVVDMDGKIVHVNSHVSHCLGYPADEFVGKAVVDVHPPDRREEATTILADVIAGKASVCPIPLESKDGALVEVETRVTRGKWDGQPVLFGISRDMSHRLQAEGALRESEEKLAGVVNAVADDIRMVDDEYNIVWANGVAEQLSGRDIVGRKCYWAYHKRASPCEPCVVQETLADGMTHEDETTVLTPNGTKILWSTASVAARHADGRPKQAVKVSRDITDRRRTQDKSRRDLAELAHVARLATMGEMATGMAHEVNQPLAAIATYADTCWSLLQDSSLPRDERLRGLLEKLQQQTVRAGDIVRHLRGFARRAAPARVEADLNEVVRDGVMLAEPESRLNRMPVKLNLEDSIPKVLIDRTQIQQVLLNLVRNALDAISAQTGCSSRAVTVTTSVNGRATVEVAVNDTGPGLAASDAERVFEPFYTTKSQGLGMGLAISRSIVEAHGGRLWASSNSDRGCTFRFTVPVARQQDAQQ